MNPRMLLALTALAAPSHAASLLTLSNPVADNTIDTSGGNNIRSDWDGLTAYPADANESHTLDYHTITIAHDSTFFHIRQVMNSTASGFLTGDQLFVIDTDQNRSTGYTGGGGTFAVGGEYLLTGNSLLKYIGSGTDWLWDEPDIISYEDWPANDHEMSLPRTWMDDPASFDFVVLTDFWGGGDAYPDGGQGGGSGSFYTYTTIPEPGAALIGSLGMLALLRRRK